MKVEVLKIEKRRAHVLFQEASPALVNAIRRTLVCDIPKMAIEDVEFHLGPIIGEEGKEYESVTPLFDEIIAHRLGLIPLPTEPGAYNYRKTCKSCGGESCPNCTIMYSINKKGPGMVLSGDMEPVGDSKLKPVDPAIPIVRLGEGQAMLVYATAELGVARVHAKWQVTHGVGYRYYPQVTLKHEKCDNVKEIVECCPVNVFEAKAGKLVVKREQDCTLCMECVEITDGECVDVKGDESRILLDFETDGSMSAKETLLESFKILEEKFGDLSEKAEKL